MNRRPAVVAYDVVDDKRRGRLFRVLRKWKLSAQYSVFECSLTQAEATELFLQLSALLDQEEDSLLLAWLDSSRESMEVTSCSGIGFNAPAVHAGQGKRRRDMATAWKRS